MNHLAKEEILSYVAPCSLLCYTCPAYKDGAIGKCAATLCNYFEGYYDFNDANLPVKYRSWLAEFETFYNRLNKYTKGRCVGCRNHPAASSGCIDGCFISECTKEHGVHFCGECPEFPCTKVNELFNEILRNTWLRGNSRIKEVGVEEYFMEKKNTSHYIDYKKDKE